MSIQVRDAVLGDADEIAAAHVASWRRGYAHIFPPSILGADEFERSRVDQWRQWTHSPTPDRRLVVGVIDDRVVGFALTGASDEPLDRSGNAIGEVHAFYVHPDVWGTAVATQLMSSALTSLAGLGVGRAVLWTLADAERARAFYGKSGWNPTGRSAMWNRYPEHPVAQVELDIDLSSSERP